MTKYTQKQLKELVNQEIAIDITNADNKRRQEIIAKEDYYTQIGYSIGVYGCNGMLLKGHNTNTLYAITKRTNAIYIF